jgi:hypothetical protein
MNDTAANINNVSNDDEEITVATVDDIVTNNGPMIKKVAVGVDTPSSSPSSASRWCGSGVTAKRSRPTLVGAAGTVFIIIVVAVLTTWILLGGGCQYPATATTAGSSITTDHRSYDGRHR